MSLFLSSSFGRGLGGTYRLLKNIAQNGKSRPLYFPVTTCQNDSPRFSHKNLFLQKFFIQQRPSLDRTPHCIIRQEFRNQLIWRRDASVFDASRYLISASVKPSVRATQQANAFTSSQLLIAVCTAGSSSPYERCLSHSTHAAKRYFVVLRKLPHSFDNLHCCFGVVKSR